MVPSTFEQALIVTRSFFFLQPGVEFSKLDATVFTGMKNQSHHS